MNLWGKTKEELRQESVRLGFPAYRGQQLHDYLYHRGVHDFAEMQQLPRALRDALAEAHSVDFPTVVKRQLSTDGQTAKILVRYHDGALVESVLMHHHYGYSVCVSTQVGCAVGCTFCASGQNGLIRNLTAEEMLAQLYVFKSHLGIAIHSLVLMGSGEPLQNYREVVRFMHLCADPDGLQMSYRNMTLSTSGITDEIYRLAKERLPITLALSLHAPNDTIRNRIMPISRRYPLPELMRALQAYSEATRRRMTCEYILIRGVNDRPEHADELARLVKPLRCHINLIPLNENEGIPLFRPAQTVIDAFCARLQHSGIAATVRKEMGKEIQAACGQLRLRFLRQTPV